MTDPNPSLSAGGPHTRGTNEVSDSSPEYVKALSIEDQKFVLVHATISTLDMLCSYVRLLITLETVVTDVMAKIIEFLKVSQACISICRSRPTRLTVLSSQAFNSRTCQVVLGAGAMRSAGLKNITAKHLGRLVVQTGSVHHLTHVRYALQRLPLNPCR
jgi:hypothetical protein